MIELDAIEEVIIERTFASIEEVLVNVIIITIQSNEANDILGYLCKELSLHTFDLIHLKRIRKNIETNQLELIVCPESYALTDEILEKLGKYDQKIVPVPKYEPQNKKEFKSWAGYWPMNFHPSEDEREREKGFSEQEKQEIHQNLYKLLEDRENVLKFYQENNYHDIDKQSMAGGIMINPKGNKLIATTSQAFQFLQTQYSDTMKICNHPLFTSTMLCINLVGDIALEKYPGKETLPLGHYLCTGLDLYVWSEPDLMSCMALVHSRIRRVFFISRDNTFGALATGNGHIHALKALNHHYRVFELKYHSI